MTSENNPAPYLEEEFAKLREQLFQVSAYIKQHRIFLPKKVSNSLDELFGKIGGTVYMAGIFGGQEHLKSRTAQQSYDNFSEAYDAFEVSIPAALDCIGSGV